MLELGTPLPTFRLLNVVSNQFVESANFHNGKGLLVMFICRHCPYVKHVQAEIAKLGNEYLSKGVAVVAISSNDAKAYPDDAPESLKQMAQELGFSFPYCYDETQDVARAFNATCTPDFYLFNGDLKLVYRGQLDDSRPRNDKPVTGSSLRTALDQLLSNQAISQAQVPSLGCNIKWREA